MGQRQESLPKLEGQLACTTEKINSETPSQTSWKVRDWILRPPSDLDIGHLTWGVGCSLKEWIKSPNNPSSCIITCLSLPLWAPLQPSTSGHSYQLSIASHACHTVLERASSVMWVKLFFPCRFFFYCGKNSRYEIVRVNRQVNVQEITADDPSIVYSFPILLWGNFMPALSSQPPPGKHLPSHSLSPRVVLFQMLQVHEVTRCLFSVPGSFYLV